MIGNSRLHWAEFAGETLQKTWDTEHLEDKEEKDAGTRGRGDAVNVYPLPITLYLASVVPSQTALWSNYPDVHVITLEQVPLRGMYPSLGIDRALALWGAGKTWGFPMLVIDAGTALTFTGADADGCLVGGAILPGVNLQFATLGQKTGLLPHVEAQNFTSLPPRYALNTPEAMKSGVIYTLMAGIKDFVQAWCKDFPESGIAITGGDRTLLHSYLQVQFPEIAAQMRVEGDLIFWGIREVVMDFN
jgi:type III pantothenate kinase